MKESNEFSLRNSAQMRFTERMKKPRSEPLLRAREAFAKVNQSSGITITLPSDPWGCLLVISCVFYFTHLVLG